MKMWTIIGIVVAVFALPTLFKILGTLAMLLGMGVLGLIVLMMARRS